MFSSKGAQAKSQRNGYGLENPGGVGIVFKSGPDEALFVKALVELSHSLSPLSPQEFSILSSLSENLSRLTTARQL